MYKLLKELSQKPKSYIEQIKNELYLSDYENTVFDLSLKGKSAVYIASTHGLSERTIYRIKKSLVIKLKNLLN